MKRHYPATPNPRLAPLEEDELLVMTEAEAEEHAERVRNEFGPGSGSAEGVDGNL